MFRIILFCFGAPWLLAVTAAVCALLSNYVFCMFVGVFWVEETYPAGTCVTLRCASLIEALEFPLFARQLSVQLYIYPALPGIVPCCVILVSLDQTCVHNICLT